MRAATLLLAVICAISTSSCAGPRPYDPDKVIPAFATLDADNDICQSQLRAGTLAKISDFTHCLLNAKIKFAGAIHLKEATVLAAYSTRMGTLAGDADAGRVTVQQYLVRLADINGDFNKSIAAEYNQNEAERQQNAASMMAMGAALQNAGAALKGPQSNSLHCTTTQMGMFTNTDCN